ncbi:pyridoxamine 5'-phosphate oxidase family protein [Nocardia sp. NPDC059240]|uniref:pyridoxamine 5'-phosphate oxidase family protein n=1 Tax=Nocardia sp. NPDC059240 TaxID=3346786 RepID=UPI0036B258AB
MSSQEPDADGQHLFLKLDDYLARNEPAFAFDVDAGLERLKAATEFDVDAGFERLKAAVEDGALSPSAKAAPGRRMESGDPIKTARERTAEESAELAALVHRCGQSDQQAFEELRERTDSRIYDVVRQVVRNPWEADRVTEDVYSQILQNAAGFDSQNGSVVVWLMTLAQRVAEHWVRIETRRAREGRSPSHHDRLKDRLDLGFTGVGDEVRDRLIPEMIDFIRRMDMLFIATADEHGECDTSLRTGKPGFLYVIDDRTVAYPEYRSNDVLVTLDNIIENPHVGILLIDFVHDQIGLHINGTARAVDDMLMRRCVPELPPDRRGPRILRWIVVDVEEAYVHNRKHWPDLPPAHMTDRVVPAADWDSSGR